MCNKYEDYCDTCHLSTSSDVINSSQSVRADIKGLGPTSTVTDGIIHLGVVKNMKYQIRLTSAVYVVPMTLLVTQLKE